MMISVIGQGFVGGSLTTVLSERNFDIFVYDKSGKIAAGGKSFPNIFLEKEQDRIELFLKECEQMQEFSRIYFVCLPTPMNEDGSADLSIVEEVLEKLASIPGERIAIVKSTVPPGSTAGWNKKFADQNLHVVFNPEFLTEANAIDDMRNQNRIVLGGEQPWVQKVKILFENAFPEVPVLQTSSTNAEMIKYVTNNFLALKVSFANEIYQICQSLSDSGLNINYDDVINFARYDERLGSSHWKVPGPDGDFGYGGHCFPKDINAMIHLSNTLGVDPIILRSSWNKNLQLRKERDWEVMIGRAVSKKN